jgi:hypothetical protein
MTGEYSSAPAGSFIRGALTLPCASWSGAQVLSFVSLNTTGDRRGDWPGERGLPSTSH